MKHVRLGFVILVVALCLGLSTTAWAVQVISVDTNWEADIDVNEGVTVSNGATLTITSAAQIGNRAPLSLESGAKVVIEEAGTLTMAGGAIYIADGCNLTLRGKLCTGTLVQGPGSVILGVSPTIENDAESTIEAPIISELSGPPTVTLTKKGIGNLNLCGANSYSGKTVVEAGVLNISGESATLPGDAELVVDAELWFNKSGLQVYGGTVTGAGRVTISTSTLTLTGQFNNSGGVSAIADLRIGNGTSAGSVSGDIMLNSHAVLTFNHGANAHTHEGAIATVDQGGQFIKIGTGTLTLNGIIGDLHPINTLYVAEGTLVLNGGTVFSTNAVLHLQIAQYAQLVNNKFLTVADSLEQWDGSILGNIGTLTLPSIIPATPEALLYSTLPTIVNGQALAHLTFDANGGTIEGLPVISVILPKDTTSFTLNAPFKTRPVTRAGYTKQPGWYDAKTGGTRVDMDGKIDFTSGKTVYAQWTTVSPAPTNFTIGKLVEMYAVGGTDRIDTVANTYTFRVTAIDTDGSTMLQEGSDTVPFFQKTVTITVPATLSTEEAYDKISFAVPSNTLLRVEELTTGAEISGYNRTTSWASRVTSPVSKMVVDGVEWTVGMETTLTLQSTSSIGEVDFLNSYVGTRSSTTRTRIPLNPVDEEIPLGPPLTGESTAYGWSLLMLALAAILFIVAIKRRALSR